MRVRFFGVRGSVPYATSASIGHGCNTPCIEVFDEATDRLLILDAGSGIVGLGETVSADRREVPILLTHYHGDHVQGLPFFAPLYRSGGAPTAWALALGRTFADLDTMFEAPFFPVLYDRLPSRPAIRMLAAGETTINGFEIGVQPLNHPGGAFAYRIRGAGGTLVYATDHEFGDQKIDDAHFTPDESPAHKGWGYGDWSQCARFASACGAAHLWLFHHKPWRTDEALTAIEAEARLLFAAADAASEGDSFFP